LIAAAGAVRVWYSHHFVLPLPTGHRFPMAKYALLYARVVAAQQRLGVILEEAPQATVEDLLRAHAPDYVERVLAGGLSAQEQRRIGFPWSPQMAERSRRVSGATIAALCAAIAGDGVGVTLAGGTHHAGHDRGAGYCVFNDSVVAARHVQAAGLAQRVLVVDLDVHQGDGTASLVRDDPTIYAFSMHAARNYPAVKPSSDLDVALPDGTGDAEYLDQLALHLPRAIAESRADAVIYLAGADPYADDRLGFLALSKPGLRERDRMVLARCAAAGLPVAVSMAGGYAESVDDIVDIHYATVEVAAAHGHRSRPTPTARTPG
jgi:acetoin utilization deacetylase AcuC-like enzyme